MPTTTTEPKIDFRPEQLYMGIRMRTPRSVMSKNISKLFKELTAWEKKNGIVPAGEPFLRYHVIDMEKEMDIEVGIPVDREYESDERVKVGKLPAGRYASLIYVGNGYTGNKALVEWARDNGLKWDRWDDERGDGFRCRYERYLTDPKVEPKKSKWEVEVAIKLAD